MTEYRGLGITLKEHELSALNLKMRQEGYQSLGELVRGYMEGDFRPTEASISDISERIASKLLTSRQLTGPADANTSGILEPRAGLIIFGA